MSYSWQILDKSNPQELIESRLQLHYAIQFIAAIGDALAEPQPDYSHSSLKWQTEGQIFVGEVIQGEKPFQVGLDPVSLTSMILDSQGEKIATFPLQQKTLAEGLEWHKQEISRLGGQADKINLFEYAPDDFPDHAIALGATFDASQESERRKLVAYYANTQQILQEIVTATEGAAPIHIWSHHFDIATLISLPSPPDKPLTIGVGLSPGDKSYNEPYWYVSPYPYPGTENLPTLEGHGFWHTQHWVGAVLTASHLATDPTQEQQVKAFLNSAIQASRALLQT